MIKISRLQVLLIALITALIIGTIAYFYAKSEIKEIKKEKYAYLEAIANLKIDQITRWRTERLSEAQFFPSVGRIIKSTVYLTINKNDKQSKDFLDQTLRPIKERHNYQNIFLTDVKKKIIFSLDSTFNEIDSTLSTKISEAIKNDSVIFPDFYKCKLHSQIHLDIISPIKDNDGRPIGAFVQQFNPYTYLYPLIQKWPTPSTSAECLIFRNEDTHIIFLSDLRFKNNAALTHTISIKNDEYVAVKGVQGVKGVLEGLDYRGVKVLSSIKKIPDSNWYLVAKIDQDEIYSDIFYRGGTIALIAAVTFLLFGAVLMYLYKYKQSSTFKNLFLKEKELAETQEEYKTALYSIGDAVITTDRHGVVKQMNVVAEELTGWKESEAKGKKLEDIFRIVDEDTHQKVENPVKQVLKEGIIIGLSNHTILINKDGKEIPIADSGSPIRNNDNQIVGVILVFRDQTEERAKEKEIYESNEKFSKIFQHASDSISLTSLVTGKVFEVNEGFVKMFGYSRDEAIGKTALELNLWENPDDRNRMIEIYKEHGNVKDFEAIGNHKNGNKISALISGEILLFNEVKYLLLSIKDITEQKLFEKNLKESEEKFRKAFITSPDSININRLSDGMYVSVNDSFTKITGYSADEVIGKSSLEINIWVDAEDRKRLVSALSEYKIVENLEARFRLKSGEIKNGLMSASLIELNGVNHIISITRDISDRKKAEEIIKSSEANLISLINNSNESIWSIDKNYNYIVLNNFFAESYFATYNQKLEKGINALNILTPELRAFWKPKYDKALSGERVNFEFSAEVGSEIRSYQVFLNPIISDGVITGVTALSVNTTESKLSEKALKLSETNLKNSQRVALVGHYEFDVATGNWSASEMLDEIFGIDNNYPHNTEGWANLLHPDDKQMMLDHLIIDVVQNQNDFNKEYRIIRQNDKEIRWMHGQGNLELDESNNAKRMFGTIQDITDRKLADEEKLKTKLHFQKLIENAPDGIVQISIDGKFKYVSPSAKRIFNYPLDKRIEESPNELTHPEDLPRVLEALNRIIQDPGFIPTIEYRFKGLTGNYIWIESTLTNLLAEPSVESIVINFRDISYRKKAEKELLEKFKLEEQISKIARTAPGGLCSFKLSTDGKVSMPFVSDAWSEIYNFNQEEVFEDATKIFTRIHPDDVGHVNQTIQKSAETLEDWKDEFRIVNPYKGIIWVEGHSTPSKEPDGSILWHGFITDITTRKNAEERLRTLSRAVEQSPAIIVITNTHGDIEYVNPKFSDVTGYTLKEAIGRNPKILKSGNTSKEEYKTLWKTISDGLEWRGEFLNKKKNGELYWESAYISPILNESGKIINYIALKEDITERKKLIADLIEAKEKAEEMNRIKAYFFANMSHELRTPFVGIVGFSELLADSLTNPDEKEMAEQILRSSKRLTDTLNKILNVTRLEFDKIELRIREVNIIELIDQLITLFSKSALNKNLELKTSFANEEIKVKTDARLIEEILSNLINNAIKYTNKGLIEVSAELKHQDDHQSYVVFQVIDTGVGIPKNKQEIIWQEFRQVSEGMNRSFEGTGLGLTIIKKYVETLNGTISLESEIGKGSRFTIIIPVEKVEKENIIVKDEIIKKTNVMNDVPQSKKPKILYVEDDAIALSYVDKVLRAYYQVETAYNANAALDMVNKNKYEAMLLDINLGKGIDGVELMQLIRKIDGCDKIPIVAVTAYAAESDRLEFLAKGFTHYLSKPFTSVDLRGLLSKIFN